MTLFGYLNIPSAEQATSLRKKVLTGLVRGEDNFKGRHLAPEEIDNLIRRRVRATGEWELYPAHPRTRAIGILYKPCRSNGYLEITTHTVTLEPDRIADLLTTAKEGTHEQVIAKLVEYDHWHPWRYRDMSHEEGRRTLLEWLGVFGDN